MSEGIVKKGNRFFVVIEGDPEPGHREAAP